MIWKRGHVPGTRTRPAGRDAAPRAGPLGPPPALSSTDVILRYSSMRQRLWDAAIAVLHALAAGIRYGFDIIDATSLPSAEVI